MKLIIIIIHLFTAIGLLPGGSCYFTCKQNMKLVSTIFKSGGLHEKHVVATLLHRCKKKFALLSIFLSDFNRILYNRCQRNTAL